MPWLNLIAVGSGAALGAWARWELGILLNPLFPTLPFGTLAANLVGGFRAIEGFGRHGVLHAQHFFELAGEMTVEVEFILTDEMADRLLESLRTEPLSLMYARLPAEFGLIGAVANPNVPR